jgi:putative acyl-CoA dehydrogenase
MSDPSSLLACADTHVVTNQVPPLEDYNPATSPVLIEALTREGGEWGLDEVTELGALAGSRQAQRWGELADRNQPILHTHDSYGHRVDGSSTTRPITS